MLTEKSLLLYQIEPLLHARQRYLLPLGKELIKDMGYIRSFFP